MGGIQPSSGWWLDTGTLPDPDPSDIPVAANVPTANDSTNQISWTPKTGVQYVIGGLVRTQPYSVGDVDASVTVTAQATTGYTLTGTSSWTFTFTASAPADTPVTPTGPTWTDDTVSGGGTWTTPTQTGVTYSPASGTATPGQAVTVTATAQAGYVLQGTTSWSHTFPVAAPPTGQVIYADTFTRANTSAGGTLGTTETGGQAWTDPTNVWWIQNNAASRRNIGKGQAFVDIGQTSARAVAKIRLTGNDCFYGVMIAGVPERITDSNANNGYIARAVRDSGGTANGSGVELVVYGAGAGTVAGLVNVINTEVADGDELDLTVVEDGTKATVTLKQNGTTIHSSDVTAAGRPQGTYVGMVGSDVSMSPPRGAIDEITVYGA